MKRHTCMICKKKRYSKFMVNFAFGYVCKDKDCIKHNDLILGAEMIERFKKLTKLNRRHLFGK